MFITQKITITNNRHIFTNRQLLRLYVDLIVKRKIKKNYMYTGDMAVMCLAIILSRKLKKFIEWIPWIKTINIYKLRNHVLRAFAVRDGYTYVPSTSPKTIEYAYNKDLQIKVLFELYELGFFFNTYNDIPESIIAATILYFDLDEWLDEFFKKQMEDRKFGLFSTRVEENHLNGEYYKSDRDKRFSYATAITQRQAEHLELANSLATYVVNIDSTSDGTSSMVTSNNYNDDFNNTVYVSGDAFISGEMTFDSSGDFSIRSVSDATTNNSGISTTRGQSRNNFSR